MKEFAIRDFFYNKLETYGFVFGQRELYIEGLKIDIFAIGENNTPFIIEFKKRKDKYIVGQTAEYLSMAQLLSERIEKEINRKDINWSELKIICIAPEFYERDLTVYKSEPLGGRINFYRFELLEDSNNQIVGLILDYLRPQKSGPLKIPAVIKDRNDMIKIRDEFFKYEKFDDRFEFYLKKVVPVFEEINASLFEYQNVGRCFHWFIEKDTYSNFGVFLSNNKASILRTSIVIDFCSNEITYGIRIPNSCLEDINKIKQYVKNDDNMNLFVRNILKMRDYDLCISTSDNETLLPVSLFNRKRVELLVKASDPKQNIMDFLHIEKKYEKTTLFESDIINIIRSEYNRFLYFLKIVM